MQMQNVTTKCCAVYMLINIVFWLETFWVAQSNFLIRVIFKFGQNFFLAFYAEFDFWMN